ncbi:tetratricopeptide repeat protein [[Eubacterium] cellulosolvens]
MKIEIEARPEFIAYRKALEMAWLDGVITYDEAKILDTLREYLSISDEEHWALQNEVRAALPNPGVKEYKMALEQVWMDGLLTDNEKETLKKLREKYNISDRIHKELELKVKSDLGITNEESECFFPEPLLTSKEDYLINQDPTDKNSELYWINEGKKQWYIGKQDRENGLKAIEFFDKAIQINPKSFIAWIYKGCIFKKLNYPDKAIICYDNAIALKKDFIASWYNKGMLLAQVSLDQIEEAIRCFNEVLKINPNHPLALRDREIFHQLAQIRMKHQQNQET